MALSSHLSEPEQLDVEILCFIAGFRVECEASPVDEMLISDTLFGVHWVPTHENPCWAG